MNLKIKEILHHSNVQTWKLNFSERYFFFWWRGRLYLIRNALKCQDLPLSYNACISASFQLLTWWILPVELLSFVWLPSPWGLLLASPKSLGCRVQQQIKLSSTMLSSCMSTGLSSTIPLVTQLPADVLRKQQKAGGQRPLCYVGDQDGTCSLFLCVFLTLCWSNQYLFNATLHIYVLSLTLSYPVHFPWS